VASCRHSMSHLGDAFRGLMLPRRLSCSELQFGVMRTASAVPGGPGLHHLRVPAAWGLPRRQLRHVCVEGNPDPRRSALADAVSQLTDWELTAPGVVITPGQVSTARVCAN